MSFVSLPFFSSNTMNRGNLVRKSDRSRVLSISHQSSMRTSHQKVVLVFLVASMCRNGIGSVSFLGTHSLFDSPFNVLKVNVVPCTGPEFDTCFTIIGRLKRCW